MKKCSLLFVAIIGLMTPLNAQWKWTLHAETGLNKQDVSAVTSLVQQNELIEKRIGNLRQVVVWS